MEVSRYRIASGYSAWWSPYQVRYLLNLSLPGQASGTEVMRFERSSRQQDPVVGRDPSPSFQPQETHSTGDVHIHKSSRPTTPPTEKAKSGC